MNKKTISPVIATALLLIVAVISVVGFGSWFGNFQSNINSNVEQSSNTKNTIDLDTIVGNSLYINN